MKLTHVWYEIPMLTDAPSQLPADVVHLKPIPGQPPLQSAQEAQVIFAGATILYTGEVFDSLPNLRMIVRTGIGIDNVDSNAAAERGVVFCNTPDGPTESTAEHAVALLLAVAKRIIPGHVGMAAGGWPPRSALIGTEVQGKTLGLVGLGRIGRRVAQICSAGLGMRVVGSDPFVPAEAAAQMGVELCSQDEVIAQADFLSLHAPSIPATYRMINRESIARMKTGAYLINVARGPLVDMDALIEALDSGKLAGAGIDVFDEEPPAPDYPIRFHPKVILTPHIASTTADGRARIEQMAVARALEFFRGEKPKDICNPQVWEKRRP